MSMLTRLVLLLLLAVLLVWNGRVMAQDASVKAGISAKLRADASRAGALVALLPGGTSVEVLEAKDDYVYVSATGKKGWVARRLLIIKAMPKAVAESRPAPSFMSDVRRQERSIRQTELALVHEEQEKNTWRMLATLIGVAMAAFLGGFWLRGAIFRQRYGWLSDRDRYRVARKRSS